jgi:hypothetical protein
MIKNGVTKYTMMGMNVQYGTVHFLTYQSALYSSNPNLEKQQDGRRRNEIYVSNLF